MGRNRVLIVLLTLVCVGVLCSCIIFDPTVEVSFYNPSDAEVTIHCYFFVDNEYATIPARGTVSRQIRKSTTSFTVFEEGRYYIYCSDKFTYSSSSSGKYTLSPNCAWVRINNNTSYTLSFVKIGDWHCFWDDNGNSVDSTIDIGGHRWRLVMNEGIPTPYYFKPLCFKIGNNSYETVQTFSSPSMGTSSTINIYGTTSVKAVN